MKRMLLQGFVLLFTGASFTSHAQQPSVEKFKEVFEAQMQKLLPEGYDRRTISFVSVVAGKANSGYYPFKVTAYVHDYDAGYPPNQYYGQSCLGKMDGWKFDMRKDEFGEWIVQGSFTVLDKDCKDNPGEGKESIPAANIPGTIYKKPATQANGNTETKPKTKSTGSQLYIGEYACYGTGGRMMTGMGFHLLANGKYYDLDKARGGSYTYDAAKGTIKFSGGFLSGQSGTGVSLTGFQISNTVRAEPWR